MSARDEQVGGVHYKKWVIQPWDVVDCYGLDFYLGNAIKYILRDKAGSDKSKSRLEDLQKSRHYLDKAIEGLEVEIEDRSYNVPVKCAGCGGDTFTKYTVNGYCTLCREEQVRLARCECSRATDQP